MCSQVSNVPPDGLRHALPEGDSGAAAVRLYRGECTWSSRQLEGRRSPAASNQQQWRRC